MKKLFIFVFLALLTLICQADMLQFQCDPRHTGVSDTVVINSQPWYDSLAPIDIFSGPVTSNGFVIVPTGDSLWCLDANNGNVRWSRPGSFSGTPAIIGDRIFVIKAESLVCYNRAGNQLWSRGFPGQPYTPTVAGGYIFLACGNQVYALDTVGNSLWASLELARSIVPGSAVCCYDSFVVATTVRGSMLEEPVLVYWLNKRTGLIAHLESYGYSLDENSSGSTLTVQDGRINFATFYDQAFPGWIRSVSTNGEQVWELRNAAPNYYASACAANGMVFWPGEGLRAYDTSGTRRWIANVGTVSYSSPIISGGMIWVGNDTGKLFGLDAVSGLIRQQFQCGSTALTSPATTSDGRLIICDVSGNVYCFGYNVAVIEELPRRTSSLKDGFYDISGRRLSNPPRSGICFQVSGGKATKVVYSR